MIVVIASTGTNGRRKSRNTICTWVIATRSREAQRTTHSFILKPDKNLNNFPAIQKEVAELLDDDGTGFNWDFAGIRIPEETVAAIQQDAVRAFKENTGIPDKSNALDLLYAMADVVRNDPRMPEKDLDKFDRYVYEIRDILIDREGRQ